MKIYYFKASISLDSNLNIKHSMIINEITHNLCKLLSVEYQLQGALPHLL